MATISENAQMNVKKDNGDLIKIFPFTKIANVDGLNNALNNKVDKVSGKGLSTNDYTTADKNNLDNLVAQKRVFSKNETFTGSYQLITSITIPAYKMCVMDAMLIYNQSPPLGLIISRSNGSDYAADYKVIAKSEPIRDPYEYFLQVHSCYYAYNGETTVYLFARSANNNQNNIALSYQIF